MAQAQARIDESRSAQGRGDESRQSQRNFTESNGSPMANILPAEFVEIGKKRVEAMMEIQKEMFDIFQEIHQAWFDRARSAATVNSELIAKLTSARSVPETADAYQQCVGKRMEMLVEDGRRLLSDSQKIVDLGTRFLTNGSGQNSSAA
ncbi:MAG: phasin family protein [Candidatus Binatia bacterium]